MSSEQEGRKPFEQQQQLLSIEDKDDSNEPSSSTKDIVPETNPWHSNLPCFFSKQDIEAVLSLPPHIQNVRLQLIPSLASDPDLANVAYIDAEFLPQRAVTIGRGTFESLSHTSRFDLSYISRKHARLDFQQPNKLLLTDLSANGTFVNGELLGTSNVCQLYEGDVVSFLLLSPDSSETALGYVVLFNRVGEDPQISSVAATQFLFLREQQRQLSIHTEIQPQGRDIISSASKVRSYAQPRRERVSATKQSEVSRASCSPFVDWEGTEKSSMTKHPLESSITPVATDSPLLWEQQQQQDVLEHFGFLPFYAPSSFPLEMMNFRSPSSSVDTNTSPCLDNNNNTTSPSHQHSSVPSRPAPPRRRGRGSGGSILEEHRRHACPWPGCDKHFSRRFTVMQHYRTHTGEKPYVCAFPGCDARFTQLSNLRQHERYHTGERPYHCDICDLSFQQMANLQQHKRRHFANPSHWTCALCHQGFPAKMLLIQHAEQAHPDVDTKEIIRQQRKNKAES